MRTRIAEALIAVVIRAQIEHMERLNVSNPFPHNNSSKAGEYPRKRTGFLQANTLYDPPTVEEVKKELFVDLGVGENAFYGYILVAKMDRLGVLDTVEDILPELETLFYRVVSSNQKRAEGE